ncbi:MAG: hypothetical protein ACYSTO_02845, partial [Planctomycetota bacterium]
FLILFFEKRMTYFPTKLPFLLNFFAVESSGTSEKLCFSKNIGLNDATQPDFLYGKAVIQRPHLLIMENHFLKELNVWRF